VKPSRRGRLILSLFLACAAATTACGKKGPPLAPMARIPSPPGNAQAARFGDEVYVWFTVPASNVSGQTPADATAVELYAVTAAARPSGTDLRLVTEKVGTYPVHPPIPPPPAPPPGAPPMPAPPAPVGFTQGATAVVRETLTDTTRQLTVLPATVSAPAAAPEAADAEAALPGPLVPPAFTELRRYYFVIATGPRGRQSAPTPLFSVPVGNASAPPAAPELTYTATALTLAWEPSANARLAPPPADPDLLPSKPLITPLPPTGYHVFEVPREAVADIDPYALALPAALTPQPLSVTSFEVPGGIAFGRERCFEVRAVDQLGGALVVGGASPPACVTPVDTFPPAAPSDLAAIAGAGVINLIWAPNTDTDLAGYIVLRGLASGGPLQAVTPAPIRETTYRDQSATPGIRYVYAVVAVDTATPQNVSAQSNRVEETSRTP
jgi:hypothetical protein